MGAAVTSFEYSSCNARRRFAGRRAFYAIALISGACSLAYEVLWARLLAQAFGETHTAVTVVLAAFMGGLALGALLARVFDRIPQQTARNLYCVVELAIAGHSIILGSQAQSLGILGGLALLPLAVLLGLTLPALASLAGRTEDDSGIGISTSRIYALHTIGACFGVIAATQAEWLPLPVMAAGNIALAWIVRSLPSAAGEQWQKRQPLTSPATIVPAYISPVFFITGFVAFLLEVALTEALTRQGANITHAFGGIVTLFLLGPALGAWAGSHLRIKGSLLATIAKCQFLLAVFFLLGYELLPLISGHQMIGTLILLPGAFLSGLSFALATRLRVRRTANCAADFGSLYAINAIGSVAGALLTGFLLVPLAGPTASVHIGVGITATLSIALMAGSGAKT